MPKKRNPSFTDGTPLQSAKTVTVQYYPMWKVDPSTGLVTTSTATARYSASSGTLSGRAILTDCSQDSHSHCLSTRSVQDIDAGSHVTLRNITGTGERQWIAFHYTVSNPKRGEAHILVNGETTPVNISELNSRAGYHGVVPVQLELERGYGNIITVGASGEEGFVVRFEGIEMHE